MKSIATTQLADRLLAVLADGSARPAGELARMAHAGMPRVREALGALLRVGRLERVTGGPHTYFRARGLLVAPADAPPRMPGSDAAFAAARTCYGHLAGRLGVALFERLHDLAALDEAGSMLHLTAYGHAAFARAGLAMPLTVSVLAGTRCLDVSERHDHLGGRLGRALATACVTAGWLRPVPDSRAVALTARGHAGFTRLGLSAPVLAR